MEQRRTGWNPWRALRARRELRLIVARLPDGCGGGYYWPDAGWAGIMIDSRLSRRERNAVLAHELIHHERGGGVAGADLPDRGAHLIHRDEAAVNDEVARRLVPLDELAQLVASVCDDGSPVTAWEIAEAFDVPEHVAARACELLRRSA